MSSQKQTHRLPEGAKKLPHKHLAEGEHTGHFHAATAKDSALFDIGGAMVMDAPSGTEITHQEHGTQTIDPGQYDISHVQEFDPFSEQIRTVQD